MGCSFPDLNWSLVTNGDDISWQDHKAMMGWWCYYNLIGIAVKNYTAFFCFLRLLLFFSDMLLSIIKDSTSLQTSFHLSFTPLPSIHTVRAGTKLHKFCFFFPQSQESFCAFLHKAALLFCQQKGTGKWTEQPCGVWELWNSWMLYSRTEADSVPGQDQLFLKM